MCPLQQAVDHYTFLMKEPGWRDYVIHMTKAMAKHYPELYAELPGLVVERVNEARKETTAPAPHGLAARDVARRQPGTEPVAGIKAWSKAASG